MMVAVFAVFVPGAARRWLFRRLLGHEIDRTARIGHSFVDVDHLAMGPGASIGHLDVLRGLERVEMGEKALIGHLNMITSVRRERGFFPGLERDPALVMDSHAKILMMHLVDCCDRVELEHRAVIAGYWSLVMTHTFDHRESRQTTAPIHVGLRTLVATRCTLLPGAHIGERCIVAAGATVIGKLDADSTMYAGTPAKAIRDLDPDAAFFHRTADQLL